MVKINFSQEMLLMSYMKHALTGVDSELTMTSQIILADIAIQYV